MPIYFVVYIQKVIDGQFPYYQILKSIPATSQDISSLFAKEVRPLQNYQEQYGGFVGYMTIYREPNNPFQAEEMQARLRVLQEEIAMLKAQKEQ